MDISRCGNLRVKLRPGFGLHAVFSKLRAINYTMFSGFLTVPFEFPRRPCLNFEGQMLVTKALDELSADSRQSCFIWPLVPWWPLLNGSLRIRWCGYCEAGVHALPTKFRPRPPIDFFTKNSCSTVLKVFPTQWPTATVHRTLAAV